MSQIWSGTTHNREGGKNPQYGKPLTTTEEIKAYVHDWSFLKVTMDLGVGNLNAAWTKEKILTEGSKKVEFHSVSNARDSTGGMVTWTVGIY